MPGGNRGHAYLKQTCSEWLQVYFSMYDPLLPPGIKGLISLRYGFLLKGILEQTLDSLKQINFATSNDTNSQRVTREF